MSALTTADNTRLPAEGQNATLLPEQLLDFANEAFVFADLSRTGPAAKAEQGSRRHPAHPQAWFADVTAPPLAGLVAVVNWYCRGSGKDGPPTSIR